MLRKTAWIVVLYLLAALPGCADPQAESVAALASAADLQKGGQQSKALQALHDAVAWDPQNVAAYAARGALFAKRNQLLPAIRDYDTVLQFQPDDKATRLARARLLLEAEQPTAALADYDHLLRHPPTPEPAPELAFERAQALHQAGQLAAAETALSELLAQDSTADTWYERGLVRQALGNLPEALADYDAALKLEPKEMEYLVARADVLLRQGQLPAAQAITDELLRKNPLLTQAQLIRSAARLGKSDAPGALADAQAILLFDPESTPALVASALAYLDLAQWEAAQTALTEAQQLSPDDVTVWLAQGKLDLLRQAWAQAEAAFGRALKRATHPAHQAAAHYGRGVAQQRLGNWDAALLDLNAAIQLRPREPGYFLARAEVYRALQQPAEAMSDEARAAELDAAPTTSN